MDWEEALEAVRRRRWDGRAITGVTEDTRRLVPGMVFVARRGTHVDGHDLLASARQEGAVLTVGGRSVAPGLPDVVVPDPGAALAHLVAGWHGDPGRRLTLVGLTGTNGKTTTAHWVAAILAAAGHAVGTIGTLGYRFAGHTETGEHTTPPPEVLYGLLARWLAAGATHVVMEVSAQALSQGRTAACPFAAAALTSFARDHGEFFPDQDAYRAAKARLFADLRGVAVLPHPGADATDHQAFAAAAAGAARTVLYGTEGTVQGRPGPPPPAGGEALTQSCLDLRLPGEARAQPVRLRLGGEHNAGNATCAAAVAWVLGVPPATLRAALASAPPPAGRAVCLHLAERGAWAVVDYGHNPAALAASLRWLRRAVPGRVYVVLGARGGRDQGKRPLMGAVVAALADGAIFTADRPAPEDAEAAAAPLLRAARDCGGEAVFVRDRARAIGRAVGLLGAGDCLLVSGKGTEPWEGDSPERGALDDAALLRELGAAPL